MSDKLSRREALGLGALFAASAVPGASAAPARGDGTRSPRGSDATGVAADLVVLNARVITMDPAQPAAEAFAVRGGRFVAVGRTEEIRALASRNTEVIDAAGMTVTPGFIDAHCHPGDVGELYDVHCDLTSIAAIQQALRARAAQTRPGLWLRGFKFDDTKLADERPLSRKDLDAVATDRPVRVDHRGGHTSWFNSRAFELAGVTRDTPDPPDGRFVRDGDGDLQGLVASRARDVFETVGEREEFTPQQQRERGRAAMAYLSRQLAAAGLTTVHDAGTDGGKLRAYQDTLADGDLHHRAYLLMLGRGFQKGQAAPYRSLLDAGVYTGLGNEMVRIGPVKFTADGSASERTMRMSTPYVGRPDDFGILVMDQKQIDLAVEEAHANRWQVGFHANGDVAIDMVLNAYERVLQKWPHPDRRHRIEHCTLLNPQLIARLKATGTIPTPFWTYVYYHGEKWKAYGEERLRNMFAHRSLLEAGIRVPGASDYTPGPFEPMMALQSMVTRTDYAGRVWGPEQRVTVDQALQVATINGAYASYEEDVKGSIRVGKYADFVVLEKDPREVDPMTLKDVRVVRTVLGGRTTHRLG
jgi:predicted amidohydrolase YtcJ